MIKTIPDEIHHKKGNQTSEEHFESRCDFYANKTTSSKQQSGFFKNCRQCLMGKGGKRKWTKEERETKLKIFKAYFPNEIEDLLQFEKEEIEREKRVQANKLKLLELQNKNNL